MVFQTLWLMELLSYFWKHSVIPLPYSIITNKVSQPEFEKNQQFGYLLEQMFLQKAFDFSEQTL
jgi:hypothetical protein